MKQEDDLTPVVATIMAMISKYNHVCQPTSGRPGAVLAGRIGRDRYGEDVGEYTTLMDASMVFIANYGNEVVHHEDLMRYLYRVAKHKYEESAPDNTLKEIIFSGGEPAIGNYKDIRITFVPVGVMYALLTITISVPRHMGSGEHMLPHMKDKLKYCHMVA